MRFILFLIVSSSLQADILGSDSRQLIAKTKDRDVLEVSRSTVAIMNRDDLISSDKGFKVRKRDPNEHRFCKGERFYGMDQANMCGGVLISPRVVLTALHCFNAGGVCSDNPEKRTARFVFGLSNLKKDVPTSNVYSCSKLLDYEINQGSLDFALIQLDRPVAGVKAVPLDSTPNSKGDELLAITTPQGLPFTQSRGKIYDLVDWKNLPLLASTTVDSLTQSSGGPIYNPANKKLRGILVSGNPNEEVDERNKCFRRKRYAESEVFKDAGANVFGFETPMAKGTGMLLVSRIKDRIDKAIIKAGDVVPSLGLVC